MYLVDTNVLSETTRRAPSSKVLGWLARQDQVGVSVITILELEHGICRLEASDRKNRLRQWLEDLLASKGVHVLPVSAAIALEAGRLKARSERDGLPRPLPDLLIAATAQVTGGVVVTRNVTEFDGLGVAVLNPF